MITMFSFQCVLIIFYELHFEFPKRKVNFVNVSKAFRIRSMNISRSLVPVLVESEQLSFKTYPPPPELITQSFFIHEIASL